MANCKMIDELKLYLTLKTDIFSRCTIPHMSKYTNIHVYHVCTYFVSIKNLFCIKLPNSKFGIDYYPCINSMTVWNHKLLSEAIKRKLIWRWVHDDENSRINYLLLFKLPSLCVCMCHLLFANAPVCGGISAYQTTCP